MMLSIKNSPLGYLLVAATEKGICSVRLGNDKKKLERELRTEFKTTELKPEDKNLRQWNQSLLDYLSGHKPWPTLPYEVRATAFQKRVWDWLRSIPSGKTYSYSEAAKAIGRPRAARVEARRRWPPAPASGTPCPGSRPRGAGPRCP